MCIYIAQLALIVEICGEKEDKEGAKKRKPGKIPFLRRGTRLKKLWLLPAGGPFSHMQN